MSRRPRMLFSAFNEFVLSHHDQGLWAHPESRQLELNSVDYWVDIAKLPPAPSRTSPTTSPRC